MRRSWLLAALLVASTSPLPAQTLRAGFGEVDVTPPDGTPRQGWNTKLTGEGALDPIFARAVVFQLDRDGVGDERPLAIVQLDVALVGEKDTAAIRGAVETQHRIPGSRVMVAATHNHAGPAMIDEALPRDENYIARMVAAAAEAVARALADREDAEIAVGKAVEWDVAYNRRVVMRDGTARTHGSFRDPDALAHESPIDPEVGVLAVRGRAGKIKGVLVNFACHPTHHGGERFFSAGYPGVLARELRTRGFPITLFLQGAAGDVAYDDPRGRPDKTMEEIGRMLAADVARALESPKWTTPATLSAATTRVAIPYRRVTDDDVKGTARGAQRFGEPGYYDRKIPGLLAMMKAKGSVEAEVQVFRVGEAAFAAQPSESFTRHGLAIKEGSRPVRTFVVCYANGMLGYLPHEEAFARGGYECTFGPPSLMAPEAGRLLAEAAVALIRAATE
ncbi:hypothetical protein [Paludisphaera mucosa]|uniref:Neutral/alkaline non-lysosomal ceramidase N-terminal domain-containing protein n=1 Tax=Paludisphaera mucosa TaxID=3030827 RepID=A0ABT6FIQ5_9BACT|nr:hypothetical protein [Paludisphaera mucosa]MDG3007427.1 hypothetical protein [Paludisphaera mucosa]